MSQYSEMMGSFIRRGNFPIEADYIFYSEAELKEFYSKPENNAILHRGLLKIVVDQESGLQSLYWVNKKETNDELEFTKLLDAESIEDLTNAVEDLEKRLQQEIEDRIAGDNALWGTENPTVIPEDLNSILDLANAVTEIREKLEEHDEALANLLAICKAIAGCEEDDVISYLQTLDYQNLTQVSQTLHKFLQEYDYTDSKINTLPELQKFLEGFTDQDNLLDILTQLWYNIQGDPLPTEEFRTLRGIEDYVRDFEADIKHQADNIQKELDTTQTGVGLSADGSYSPDQETYYLKDATSVMNALKTLDWYVNEAIKYCRIRPTDTNTLDLTVNHYDEYNEILGEVKISKEEGNGIIVKEDGLYQKVRTTYSTDGILTLYVNEEIVAQHNLGLAYIGISSAYYDTTTEDLVIVFEKEDKSTEELRIPVYSLIREWTVNNSHPEDVVVLTRKEVLGGAPDELSADVRLFDDKYNILVKEGNTLYVKGTSSNIIHDGDITVENKINDHEERITTLEERSDNLEEKLNQEIKDREEADENLQSQIDTVQQQANDIQAELDITQEGVGLNLDGTYIKNEQASYISDATSIHDATQKLDVALKTESDRAIAAEEDLQNKVTELTENTTVQVIDTNTVDLTKAQEEIGYSIKADVKIDSDDAANIIITNSNGLTASVDLTYDKENNKLIFATTGNQSKEIQLTNHSLVDSITYDKATESIIFIYSVDGVKQEPVIVPVHDLIQEWTVVNDSQSPIKLTKTIVQENGQDELSAEVILSTDADNILVNQNGALKVSNAQIVLNTDKINQLDETLQEVSEDLQTQITETQRNLEAEKTRATQVEAEIKEALTAETNRAVQEEQKLADAISREELRATNAEAVLTQSIANTNTLLESEKERSIREDERLKTQIETETTRAKDAESALENAINTEVNRAQLAEQDLQAQIDANSDLDQVLKDRVVINENALNDEITRSATKDEELTQAIIDTKSELNSAINTVQDNLNIESNRAQRAEQQLTEDLADEVATREHDINVLTNLLNTETSNREAADANLQEQIDELTEIVNESNSGLEEAIDSIQLVKDSDLQYSLMVEGENRGTIVIPEDQFLKSVDYDPATQTLTFVFDTGAGEAVTEINVSDLVDIYTAGHGLSLSSNNVFEVVIDTASESFLTVSANGVKLSGVQNAIDTAVNTAVTNEKNRAELAEVTLQNAIDNEKVRAEAAEQALRTDLNNEIARAKESEQAITDRITTIENVTLVELNNKVDSEITRSKDKDSALEKLIQDETNRATAAESQLSNDLAAETARAEAADEILENNITIEKNRAEAAEQNLSDRIDALTTSANTEIADLKTQLNAEITRSTEKDTELTNALLEESNRAKLAEQNISSTLQNEVTRSTEKDAALETAINNEVTRAKESEQDLYVMITNEVTRATEAETDLQNQIDALTESSQGQLDDVIAKNEEQDAELAKKIESVTVNKISDLQYDVLVDGTSVGKIDIPKDQFLRDVTYNSTTKDLEFNFVTTDSDSKIITINIADLIDTYKAGDGLRLADNTFHISLDATTETFLTVGSNGLKLSGVQTAIDTAVQKETDRASLVEQNLQTQINKNLNDISTVSSKLEQAINEFTQADTNLQNQITTEVNTARLNEQNLQNQINANKTAIETNNTNTNTAITNLTSKLETEITRSTEKDIELQRQIDNEVLRIDNSITNVKTDLQNQITNEVNRAISEETRIEAKLDLEIQNRKDGDTEIIERITELENNSVTNLQTQITEIIEKNKEQDNELEKKIESVQLIKNSDLSYSILVDGVNAGDVIIPEDQFLKDVTYSTATKEMTFTFDTGADTKTTIISLQDLITDTTYTDGAGLALRDKQFRVVIDPTSDPYLTVGDSGVKLSGVDTAIGNEAARAAAAEDSLRSAITSEVSRAQTEEGKLLQEINNTKELVTTETTRAKEVEVDLQEQIDEINTSIGGNVVNELTEIREDITKIEGDITNINEKIDVLEDGLNEHVKDFNNPHKVTKAQVGLDKVENIAPSEMPISNLVKEEITNINLNISKLEGNINDHISDTNNPHEVTKEQVGLGNVDNTSDINKPISVLQQAEFNRLDTNLQSKANQSDLIAHINNTNNPHNVTKSHIGLDKVDNTSDMEKPISLAVQEALNNIKLEATNYATKDQLDDHKSDKNNPHNVTALQIGLGNVNNTSDADKPISLATQQALDKKSDIDHDHTMADISDLENFPVVKGFISTVAELPETAAGGDRYIAYNNGRYVLYEYDGGNGSWKEKLLTTGMVASVVGKDVYKLNPNSATYARPERILDESDYKETYDRIWNETKDLIQSIEWEENDATSDSNGQIRLKITTKKTYAAPVVDENGNAVQPTVTPKVTYIDIDKTRFLKSAYSRPATAADVTNGYATAVGVPVLVMELTTGDEVVIDLSQTMNIYNPTDTNSIDMSVSDWTGTAGTSYKISAAVRRNTTEDVKDAVELVETTGGLTANLTVKDTNSINLTNDTKANGGLRADLVIDNDENNLSDVLLTIDAQGLSAEIVVGEYD